MAAIFFFYLVDLVAMNKNKVFPTYKAFYSLNLVENKNAVSDRKNLQKYLIFKKYVFPQYCCTLNVLVPWLGCPRNR